MLISLSFKWQLTKVTISALPVPWIGYALSEDWPICLRSVFPIKWQGSSWPWATINQAYDLLSIISDKNRFFFPQAAWGSLARVNRKHSLVSPAEQRALVLFCIYHGHFLWGRWDIPMGDREANFFPFQRGGYGCPAAAWETFIRAQSWGWRPEPDELKSLEKGPRSQAAAERGSLGAGSSPPAEPWKLETNRNVKNLPPPPFTGEEMRSRRGWDFQDGTLAWWQSWYDAGTGLLSSHPSSPKEGRMKSALARLTIK